MRAQDPVSCRKRVKSGGVERSHPSLTRRCGGGVASAGTVAAAAALLPLLPTFADAEAADEGDDEAASAAALIRQKPNATTNESDFLQAAPRKVFKKWRSFH